MSFASILGPSNNEPSPKISQAKLPRPSTPPPKPVVGTRKSVEKHEPKRVPFMNTNGTASTNGFTEAPSKPAFSVPTPGEHIAPSKPRKMATDGEADRILKALALIDETTYHDTDAGFYEFKELFQRRTQKRKAAVEESESRKKRVCPHLHTVSYPDYPLLTS